MDYEMTGICFSLTDWCAFSPQLQPGGNSRLLDAALATDVTFLPAISRRRMSKLSKLSLRLAQTCAPGYQGYAVFGSQHGELVTTQGLLESIVQGEIVSPAGFSASVHNTAVGLHSIHNKNTYPCTSIAAGRDTLAMCFIETAGLLANGAEQVLVVIADEALPDVLQGYVDGESQLKGFAALVTSDKGSAVYELIQTDGVVADKKIEPLSSLVSFLLQPAGTEELLMAGETVDWRWRYYD